MTSSNRTEHILGQFIISEHRSLWRPLMMFLFLHSREMLEAIRTLVLLLMITANIHKPFYFKGESD